MGSARRTGRGNGGEGISRRGAQGRRGARARQAGRIARQAVLYAGAVNSNGKVVTAGGRVFCAVGLARRYTRRNAKLTPLSMPSNSTARNIVMTSATAPSSVSQETPEARANPQATATSASVNAPESHLRQCIHARCKCRHCDDNTEYAAGQESEQMRGEIRAFTGRAHQSQECCAPQPAAPNVVAVNWK